MSTTTLASDMTALFTKIDSCDACDNAIILKKDKLLPLDQTIYAFELTQDIKNIINGFYTYSKQ